MAEPLPVPAEPRGNDTRRLNLRERVLGEGVGTLGEVELVALLLGTGTAQASVRQAAATLLDTVGGLERLSAASPATFAQVPGVGPVKAVRLAAAMELGRRCLCEATAQRPGIMSFQQVCDWAAPRLLPLDHEELWLLGLDGQNALKSWRRIAVGGLTGCAVTIRDVLGHALRDNASAIVLVHNHPSGCPEPSADDVHMTEQLSAACRVVGTPLLDHVVVARGGAVSLFERGLVV